MSWATLTGGGPPLGSKAIRFNPYMAAVWYNLGTLYESCKQPPDAKDAYQVQHRAVCRKAPRRLSEKSESAR